MLGKGLSSLIPKKDSDQKSEVDKEKEIRPESFKEVDRRNSLFYSQDSYVGSERQINNRFLEKLEKNIPKKEKNSYRESIFQIEVEKIKPNPYQPRRDFKEEELKDLAESIRTHGILQPLVVSKIERETENGTEVEYQLIAGERRLMAAKMIGLERVPVIIRDIDDKRYKLELALIENVQRSNLNPLEAARAYVRLQEEFNLTQMEIAIRVGKSREAIANTIRLLKLPPQIQEALAQGKINESQARTLLAIDDLNEQDKVFRALLSEKLTVRDLKERVVKSKTFSSSSSEVYWQKKLEEKLGTPVKVIKNGPKGKLIIQFYSEKEWQNILEKLIGSEEF